MRAETVVFIGGPLDGQTQQLMEGTYLYQVPVQTPNGQVRHHRYGQADFLDPSETSFDGDGARRYLYQGERPEGAHP